MAGLESSAMLSHVELEGGPSHLRGKVMIAELDEVIVSDRKIKIRYLNGYEHYESIDASSLKADAGVAQDPVKFRWTGRTKIAE